MPIARLKLLVLRCRDLEASRRFYEALGLLLTTEQHGSGPIHYSCQLGDVLLELYPGGTCTKALRLGIVVPNVPAATEAIRAHGGHVVLNQSGAEARALVHDPDENTVELSEEPM